MSSVPLYDSLAVDYDRFVNWEARLSHELPFFARLFAGQGVQRVLDSACGTGHHAIALAQRGYKVVGADLSEAMVQRARENAAAAGVEVAFATLGLGELTRLGETFDVVLCLGNSFPHLLTASLQEQCLADFAAVLRPGGLLVIQNRNFDQVWSARDRFMPTQSHRSEDGEWLFVRFYDFHEETITFNMIRLWRAADGWSQSVESTELRPVFRQELKAALETHGFEGIRFLGGYDGAAFNPTQSGDLLAVAQRQG